jgi:hypothetical protein
MSKNSKGNKSSQPQTSPPKPDLSLIGKSSRRWSQPVGRPSQHQNGIGWIKRKQRLKREYYKNRRFYQYEQKEKRKFPIIIFLFLLILFSVIGGLLSGFTGIIIGVGIVFFIALIRIIICL